MVMSPTRKSRTSSLFSTGTVTSALVTASVKVTVSLGSAMKPEAKGL